MQDNRLLSHARDIHHSGRVGIYCLRRLSSLATKVRTPQWLAEVVWLDRIFSGGIDSHEPRFFGARLARRRNFFRCLSYSSEPSNAWFRSDGLALFEDKLCQGYAFGQDSESGSALFAGFFDGCHRKRGFYNPEVCASDLILSISMHGTIGSSSLTACQHFTLAVIRAGAQCWETMTGLDRSE